MPRRLYIPPQDPAVWARTLGTTGEAPALIGFGDVSKYYRGRRLIGGTATRTGAGIGRTLSTIWSSIQPVFEKIGRDAVQTVVHKVADNVSSIKRRRTGGNRTSRNTPAKKHRRTPRDIFDPQHHGSRSTSKPPPPPPRRQRTTAPKRRGRVRGATP